MGTELNLFHFDEGRQSFEDLGVPNGATHWREADVREALGYETKEAFAKALRRAKQACLALGYHCETHLALQPDGEHFLTRFGCHLVAMNGDPKKPQVAAAQVYFAALAETFESHLQHADGIDRILIRDEVADGQKTLSSTAKSHGVVNYAFFQNQGYVGMYNMSLEKLCRYKGVPQGETLIDRMSKTELAAHLFRVTQTEAKIKNDKIRGQQALERTAFEVGRDVRNTVERISGKAPEDLRIAENIRDVKKKLKGTEKRLRAIDQPAKSAKKKKSSGDAPPGQEC